jgi:hypothetical protein
MPMKHRDSNLLQSISHASEDRTFHGAAITWKLTQTRENSHRDYTVSFEHGAPHSTAS